MQVKKKVERDLKKVYEYRFVYLNISYKRFE